MNPIQEDILMHYGVKRRSGRYPWGSGDNPYQHGGDFLSRVEELQRLGKSEKEIAQEIGLSTTDLRMQVRVAKHERRALQADRARSLRDDGKTLDEIASIMGFKNDSSVRALLNESTAENKNKARVTAEILKKEGIQITVVDMFTVKPLDEALVEKYAKATGAVVTAENHNKIGGLYSAVTEVLSKKCPTPVEYVAVEDVFGEVGPQDYLEERFGLTAEHIVKKVKAAIDRK